jgi:hypothetical protein
MNYRLVTSVCVVLAILSMASFAQAEFVVGHTGSANPTTEGWSAGGGGTFGPGGTDAKPYWDITTTSESATGDAYYYHTLSSSDVSGNWLYEANVKVPTPTSGEWGPSDCYLNAYVGTHWYFIGLNDMGLYQSTGAAGSEYDLQLYSFTPDPSTYYTLSMKQTGSGVDVYVDGILRASTIAPRVAPNYGNLLYWGDGGPNSAQGGNSRWNSVVFDTNGTPAVPEPGSMVLLIGAIVGLLCYAWKRSRR